MIGIHQHIKSIILLSAISKLHVQALALTLGIGLGFGPILPEIPKTKVLETISSIISKTLDNLASKETIKDQSTSINSQFWLHHLHIRRKSVSLWGIIYTYIYIITWHSGCSEEWIILGYWIWWWSTSLCSSNILWQQYTYWRYVRRILSPVSILQS